MIVIYKILYGLGKIADGIVYLATLTMFDPKFTMATAKQIAKIRYKRMKRKGSLQQ